MQPHGPARVETLAGRLRELRQESGLTQRELAVAIGKSVPLISSWEGGTAKPPESRLRQYAVLFAGSRPSGGVVVEGDLTPAEMELRDRLLRELLALRDLETNHRPQIPAQPMKIQIAGTTDTIGGGSWYFADGRPITIVCSKLPDNILQTMPNTDPTNPDYVAAYRFSDLDAMLELHGHIRAVNPASTVEVRTPDEVTANDLTTHVILLGGIDWNDLTRDLLPLIDLPVKQVGRPDDNKLGYFAVGDGDDRVTFPPSMDSSAESERLVSDVALFYRGPNPNNELRTLTICNGMYACGTYGAVRALTDVRFRDRNERFVTETFPRGSAYCVLSRVTIFNYQTVTPDWTSPSQRLFEWAEPDA